MKKRRMKCIDTFAVGAQSAATAADLYRCPSEGVDDSQVAWVPKGDDEEGEKESRRWVKVREEQWPATMKQMNRSPMKERGSM